MDNPSSVIARIEDMLLYNDRSGRFRWKSGRRAGRIAGTRHCRGYTQIQLDGVAYMAHHLVWLIETKRFPTGYVTHANKNRLDNRFENLEYAGES